MRVLVTRPEPDAAETAARLAALGHAAVVAPLLSIVPRDWTLPNRQFDAVALTSANAVRLAGPQLTALLHLPVFAVGAATAAAARAAGFGAVTAGQGGVASLAAQLVGRGPLRLLRLAGEDRVDTAWPANVAVSVRTVYAAEAAAAIPEAACAALASGRIGVVLLYSPRTAAAFAALCDAHGLDRAALAIAAISPAAIAAAGRGWGSAAAAAHPDEAALFAAAGLTIAGERVEGADGAAD